MIQPKAWFCRLAPQNLIFALMVSLSWSTVAANERDDVIVTIHNDSPEPLRCEAILAHFVTMPLFTIPRHQSAAITLRRDLQQGTLSLGEHKGSPMMLENILCAVDTQWTATKTDLPILDIRANPADHFSFSCKRVGRFLCSPASP